MYEIQTNSRKYLIFCIFFFWGWVFFPWCFVRNNNADQNVDKMIKALPQHLQSWQLWYSPTANNYYVCCDGDEEFKCWLRRGPWHHLGSRLTALQGQETSWKQNKKQRWQQNTSKNYAPVEFLNWPTIQDSITDASFKRKFCMSKEIFHRFCEEIIIMWVMMNFDQQILVKQIKFVEKLYLVMGLHILMGGSYLDLIGLAFGV